MTPAVRSLWDAEADAHDAWLAAHLAETDRLLDACGDSNPTDWQPPTTPPTEEAA